MRSRRVLQMPLSELWTTTETLPAKRLKWIGRAEVGELLQHGPISFVVADCGQPLEWIPLADRFQFWKEELKPRIVESESGFRFEDFPGEYCYVLSQWEDWNGTPIVLCEKHH